MEELNNSQEEVSLREIILKIQEYYRAIISSWMVLLFFIALSVAYMLYVAFTTPVKYRAELTYMLKSEGGSTGGGLGGLAASFGLGSISNDQINIDKMLALSKTRNIIQQALFEKITVKGEEDFCANHIIDVYELNTEWKKNKELSTFRFTQDSIDAFEEIENRALLLVHKAVIGSDKKVGLFSTKFDNSTGIITLATETRSEDLSLNMVNIIYEKVSDFYIRKSVEQQQATYDLTKSRTDSLKTEYEKAQYSLLKFKDTNRGLSLRQYELKELLLQRKVQLLSIAYGEAQRNVELANFALKSNTPFVQSIDLPILPLRAIRKSKIKAILTGVALGVFFGALFIGIRKTIRDAMEEN